MKKTLKGLTAATLASAAFAGLLAGQAKAEILSGASIGSSDAASLVSPGMNASGTVFNEDTHACKGHNACKGKGGCKSGDNGCKGKNSCKGKGGCKTEAPAPTH